jgi:hypothetical protein
MSNYGFILTRHVNSALSNRYWNQSVKLIRTFYPMRQIVIIDDNSNQQFVRADFEYKNLTIIQSEFPQRGELLPYIYYLKYKWFPNAVIIHDSVFIHKRIPFEKISMPVLPLWHHDYDKENLVNLNRIAYSLKNNGLLIQKLNGDVPVLNNFDNSNFILCFGCQCFIKLNFLEMLENKYQLSNLVNVVHNRTDRCALERIMGLLFCIENPKLLNKHSLFGNIFSSQHRSFNYDYESYKKDLINKRISNLFVKVWTGR